MPADPKDTDPKYTLIVRGDDGEYYKLERGEWRKDEYKVTDAAGLGVISQLSDFGSYLAYIPPDLAVGIGHLCTVVDIKAILQNKLPPEKP